MHNFLESLSVSEERVCLTFSQNLFLVPYNDIFSTSFKRLVVQPLVKMNVLQLLIVSVLQLIWWHFGKIVFKNEKIRA